MRRKLAFALCFVLLASLNLSAANKTKLRFEVSLKQDLVTAPQTGRLFVILYREEKPEPRIALGKMGKDAPFIQAGDANQLAPGKAISLDQTAITFPVTNLSELPAGDYYVQALLDSNLDLRSQNAPGNLYSDVQKLHLDPANRKTIQLELSKQIAAEQLPAETELIKFVKIQSHLLSDFHHRPIYLRAGIILPRDYNHEPTRKYPLWVRVGGFNTRYTAVQTLMGKKSDFKTNWMSGDVPGMILLQLDGAGPFGDCYQVNSANNGPYGDAITQELIPYVEQKFRAIGQPHARVLSGHSTGGWGSLALQIFYPDFFNGVWSSSPDPVDFRALELIDLYEADNAYVNEFGFERPSERIVNGDTKLTMRREVQIENVLGRGNSWTMSGGQWCAWNATYSPRGKDGQPMPAWNPLTGKIDHQVAEQWKKYDLRLILEQNWQTLGPKLQGKLHISVGDADNYFLNNAVHLLDNFLSKADPPYKGRITYGPGKGHSWHDMSLREVMNEMKAATEPVHH
ncbi:MAG: esterase [Pedosphaera sp.]|nr:esterase [Pedosphaera sp.]